MAKRNSHKSWKKAERRVATFFGCKRTILSGSMSANRGNSTNADTDHDRFFIEIKQRRSHGVWSWYREAKEKAAKEKKLPLVVLDEIRAPGSIICIHQNDLEKFCKEFLSRRRKRC